MAGLEVMEAGVGLQPGYLAPTCRASGSTRSVLFRPHRAPLWELEAELGSGVELSWGTDHGDEVVYVLDGELEVNGARCRPRGVAIIEAGVATSARAVNDVRILHFGPVSTEPPADGPLGAPSSVGRHVHVINVEDAVYLESDDGERASLHYADSTCETCRVAFFENIFREPDVVSSHTHTQDEIMRMTSGEIQMGPVALRTGMSVSIPGDHRYGFRSSGAFSFLNYRRDLSMYVGAPGATALLETVETVRGVRSGELLA